MRLGRSIYKTPAQVLAMVEPGLVTARCLAAVRDAIQAGISTLELDAIAERTIRAAGAVPNFMKEPGYYHSLCVSVNDAVVHGVPSERVLEAGDIVSIDAGAELGGWNGDAAITVVVPDPSRPELVATRQALSDATEYGMWAGIASLARITDLNHIGGVIEDAIRSHGNFGIIEDFVGHGIGRSMHEEPPVFNYHVGGRGPRVKPGLVIAIEPMVTEGTIGTHALDDDWTIVTNDGGMAAHWEHSVAVHDAGLWVLTAHDGGAEGLAPFGVVPIAPG